MPTAVPLSPRKGLSSLTRKAASVLNPKRIFGALGGRPSVRQNRDELLQFPRDRARSRKSSLEVEASLTPTWTDLFLWAVIIGEHTLARVIFLSQRRLLTEPMRSALLAAKFCRHYARCHNGIYSDDMMAQANDYESWAVGLLDHVVKDAEAHALLTMVPSRRYHIGGVRSFYSPWSCSVLDEAIRGTMLTRARIVR